MNSIDIISAAFDEHCRVLDATRPMAAETLGAMAEATAQALEQGRTLFLCGNGGSAADSQHIAAEFVGRFRRDRRPLRALALTTDTSALTCITNDYDYAEVFSRQLEAHAHKGDVLLAISTSGNSPNVAKALTKARGLGVLAMAFLGKDGGTCRDLAEIGIVVPSATTARIQEAHIVLGHLLCELIEDRMGFG